MAGQVPAEVKKQRSEGLRAAVDDMAAAYGRRFLGASRTVLWEEELDPLPSSEGRLWTGLTDNYLRVQTMSDDDLLGVASEVRLDNLAGETFQVEVPREA